MPNVERVNIAPQAREMREDGYVLGYSESHFDPSLGTKPELYALTAVLIEDFVRGAYAERDVNKMTARIYPLDPFAGIKEQLHEEIREMAFSKLVQLESDKGREELQTVFDRFQALRRATDPTATNLEFLETGIGTATNVMANVLALIPSIAVGERTHQRMSRAAEASYPLIVRLAAMHKVPFVDAVKKLTYRKQVDSFRAFNQNYFHLMEVNGQERLALNSHGEEIMDQVRREQDSFADVEKDGPLIGCPALVNFGEGSAIRTLWNWHMEIGGRVYPMLYPSEATAEEAA